MTAEQERPRVNTDYDSTAYGKRGDKAVLVAMPPDLLDKLGGIAVAFNAPNLASVLRRAITNHVEEVSALLNGPASTEADVAQAQTIVNQAIERPLGDFRGQGE